MATRTMPLPLGTTSNPGRYGYDGAGRLINAYVEARGPEGRQNTPIYAIDGLASFASPGGTGGVRAMLAVGSLLYAVVGRLVLQIDSGGSATSLGGLPSDGPVYMARNRRVPHPQIAVVCDGLYYLIENGVLTQIEDVDLPPPSSVTHLDGHFLFAVANGQVYQSDVDNGASIDGLAFATAESNPDPLAGVTTRGRELLPMGEKSIEFWSNVGAVDFSFQRAHAIEIGCLSGKSVAPVKQTVAFVSSEGTVCALNGYTPDRVSNHAVERFIADTVSGGDTSGLVATSWSDRGHIMYALSSPLGTWTLDLATGLWHERKSYGLDRWRVSSVERFGTKLVAGHYSEPIIYTMSPDTHSEGSDPILWEIRAPTTHAFPGRVLLNRLDVDVIPGVGLNTTDTENADPKIMIDSSEDGGLTFDGERAVPVGGINERLATVSTYRHGLIRPTGRTLRMRMSADVVRGLMGASMTLTRLG